VNSQQLDTVFFEQVDDLPEQIPLITQLEGQMKGISENLEF